VKPEIAGLSPEKTVFTSRCTLKGDVPRARQTYYPSLMKTAELITFVPGKRYQITEHSFFAGAPFPLKVALFDIDGTVVGRNHGISPKTKDAIAALKGRGVTVGFATGRASFATREVGGELGIDGPSMFFAGSLIQDLSNEEVLYRVDLRSHSIAQLLDLAQRRRYHIEFYTESDFFAERMTEELVIHQQYCSKPAEIAPLRDLAATTRVIKGVMMTTAGQGEEQLRGELRAIDDISVTYSYGAVHPDIVFANIVDSTATREAAFEELLRINRCTAEVVATFGDSEADCAFLRAARFGIATGNGVTAAKEAARFVTTGVDDGGVGLAIEKLFLEARP
jgi:Cof subfamily protein (haloacid dehalogenase superfamily)